jgi:hypothetical protein
MVMAAARPMPSKLAMETVTLSLAPGVKTPNAAAPAS